MVATRVRSALVCGFCQSGNCNYCPRAVRNGDGRILPCSCSRPYCGGQVVRCLSCKNENDGEVSPDDWRCIDREACALAVQARLDGNVHVQMVREVMRRVSENTATEAKADKAAKAKKEPTFCAHGCGEQTGGGLFRPGHDAKYVAEKVRAVVDDKTTSADDVLRAMSAAGMSETLQGKFAKSVDLAKADRERRAKIAVEADQKAKEKADAETKAAAERAAQIAKEGEEPVVVTPDTDPESAKSEKAPARKLASSKKS